MRKEALTSIFEGYRTAYRKAKNFPETRVNLLTMEQAHIDRINADNDFTGDDYEYERTFMHNWQRHIDARKPSE